MLVAYLPLGSFGLYGKAGELFDASLVGFRPYSTTVQLYPTADSWVDANAPTANKGGDTKLHSRSDGILDERLTYIKFDLSSLPTGVSILSARVYVWETGGDSAAEVIEVRFVSDDSWTEYGITYNNRPSYASAATDSVSVGQNAYFSWNVASDVASQFAGDEVLSLVFRTTILNDHKDWYSKEYSCGCYKPYLEVTYATLHHFSVYATPSTVQVGQSFSVIVTAKDSSNNTITSWTGPVTLSAVLASNPSVPGGGVLGITSTTITSGGTVTVTGETYTKVETIKIKAISGSITGLSNPVNFIAGNAYKIEYVSGSGQSQAVATALSSPFVAKVTDQYGNPVSGRTVTWAITDYPAGATGQSLSVTSGPTDANGLASSTLTLGTKVGMYKATASSTGLVGSPVNFNATATAGAAYKIEYVSGNGQSQQVTTTLANAFVARVTDQYDNPIAVAQ